GTTFQNCAEPWMAEPKRKGSYLQRVLKGGSRPTPPPKLKTKQKKISRGSQREASNLSQQRGAPWT
ncbi:MAG: hypothetical protein R3280_16600, partial [Marinobacter sp.]|uniref:hypothetical protein n=1 Tax=Marinobacter sp. TaxID=50741 RepID=UPI00299CFE47